MKSTDEVVTEHLGPPVVPLGQRRIFLIIFSAVALALVGLYWFGSQPGCACAPPPPTQFVPPTPDISSPVDGVITAVDSSGLSAVRGFTLRPTNGGGFSFGFVLGVLENATEFSPSHLAEHMASSEPVRVWFRTENGVHTVYRLEDAP